jgi:hypothetical protein
MTRTEFMQFASRLADEIRLTDTPMSAVRPYEHALTDAEEQVPSLRAQVNQYAAAIGGLAPLLPNFPAFEGGPRGLPSVTEAERISYEMTAMVNRLWARVAELEGELEAATAPVSPGAKKGAGR